MKHESDTAMPAVGKLPVLIVEDDETLGRLIARVLSREGYEAHHVTNGEEARNFIAGNHDVIMLLDYSLPDVNGRQLVETLRETGLDIPFIIMTGHGDERIAVDMMKSGAHDYIVKDAAFLERLPNVMRHLNADLGKERELVRARREAVAAARRWQVTFDGIGDPLWLLSPDYEIQQCNEATCLLLDKPKDEIVGRKCYAILHGTSVPIDGCPCSKMMVSLRRESAVLEIGARFFEATAHPLLDKKNKLAGIVHSISDKTVQITAERQLKESEARYRALIESSADGILIADVESRIFTYANDAACRLLGYTKDELTGMGVPDIHPAESLPFVTGEFDAQARGEKRLAQNIPCQRKDGRVIYADFNTSTLTIDGRLCNLGFMRDMTELKKAGEEKHKLQDQLQQAQKMEAIGQLAGGVAHDFNNALGGIIGFADLLKLNIKPDGPLSHYVDRIIDAGMKAAGLTRQLLAFARKGRVEIVMVDIHTAVKQVIGILERTIDKRIEIRRALNAGNHVVMGDAAQLENVLLNLAINARDAMPGGGTVTIETAEVVLDGDAIQQKQLDLTPGAYLVTSITDTGIGMDENTLGHLFEPFFTTKEPGKGTGLGLASVYGTVKQHNGHITVKSASGAGASFAVYLPACNSDGAVGVHEEKAVVHGKGMVLVVDDEKLIQEFVVNTLNVLGYSSVACNNGMDAVDYYAQNPNTVDLVLLDLIMPRMNGIDCFRKLKEINPHVKVVVASGYSDNTQEKQIVADGVYGFIRKPYRISELSKTVAGVLAGQTTCES